VPKVSQEYRDARRSHILAAAKRCFLRNGFQGTSMQDLFAESGLSSGAFYLYFSGKDELILAIAEENMAVVASLIRTLAASDQDNGLGEGLATVLETIRRQNLSEDLGAMAVLVWSEAVRNPELRARFSKAIARMRSDLAEVVTQRGTAEETSGAVRPDGLAQLLITIIPGYILQLALFGQRSVARVPDAARAVWPK
jgi:AcrR family transcriptional regulator